jgi:hypothetical protein
MSTDCVRGSFLAATPMTIDIRPGFLMRCQRGAMKQMTSTWCSLGQCSWIFNTGRTIASNLITWFLMSCRVKELTFLAIK